MTTHSSSKGGRPGSALAERGASRATKALSAARNMPPDVPSHFSGRDPRALQVGAQLDKQQAAWAKSLTNDERWALSGYKGAGSDVFNAVLRHEANPSWSIPANLQEYTDTARALMPDLISAMNRASLPENTWTWRGVSTSVTEAQARDLIGTAQTWPGFTSTSIDFNVAASSHFSGVGAYTTADRPAVVYRLLLPKGTQAAWMEGLAHSNEAEILLNRNAQILVTDVSTAVVSGAHFTIITAEVP